MRKSLIGLIATALALVAAAPAWAVQPLKVEQVRVHPVEPGTGGLVPAPPLDDDWFTETGTTALTQAGARADLLMRIDFCEQTVEDLTQPWPTGSRFDDPECDHPPGGTGGVKYPSFLSTTKQLKDLQIDLPPGMLGNPQGAVPCPQHMFIVAACGPESIVGLTNTAEWVVGVGAFLDATNSAHNLYNVETLGWEPARIGTDLIGSTPGDPVPTLISFRSEDDYGITSRTLAIPFTHTSNQAKIDQINIRLFGDLSSPPAPGSHFMRNPTSCGEQTVRVKANSYQSPNTYAENTGSFVSEGCDDVRLGPDPTVSVDPDTKVAGVPSAYTVGLHLPNTEGADVAGADLRKVELSLPQGIGLAAAAGDGLVGCGPDQFGVDPSDAFRQDNDPVRCPDASKVGDVSVTTPIFPQPLSGEAYFAEPDQAGPPTTAHPWRLFISIEGPGARIKLVGNVTLDQHTGQITTRFDNRDLPPTPFTDFELKLKGGSQAVLQNPIGCSVRQGSASIEGWNGQTKNPAVTLDMTGPEWGGCPASPPFSPTVGAHADSDQAGASSPSHLTVDRPDGQDLIERLEFALPAGLVGSLTAAPQCSAAAAAPTGACPDSTRVGGLHATVGGASSLLQVPGSLYLAEPTAAGDVASLVAVIPAKVGPIDLGQVVIVNHIRLRQSDGGLTAVSDAIPTILGGIPLTVRHIQIDVDRPGFLRNPTGCEPRELKGSFTSKSGSVSSSSVSLSATNCGALPFSPKLRLIVPGGASNTKKGRVGIQNHTPLTAIVTQNAGEASIRRAEVVLPSPIRPDTGVLNQPGVLCTTAQATIGACGTQSQVGVASVITPVLPQALSGPVYIVQDPGNVLPKLLVQLRGMAAIDLVAANRIAGVRTVNTFDGLPDVPQSRFELQIKGGPGGILFNFEDLCRRPNTADVTFTGHSGAVSKSSPLLEVEGCGAQTVAALSIRTKRTRMTKKGVVKLKVSCALDLCEKGKAKIGSSARKAKSSRKRAKLPKTLGRKSFALKRGTKTIRVRLKRSAQRAVKRKKRGLRTYAAVQVQGAKQTKRIRILAPRTKKRSKGRR